MKKILIALGAIAMVTVLAACEPQTNQPGKYAEIAQCLSQKGVKFYGAFWCPHCQDQKKIFGSDMQYINYVECDPKGQNANPEECQKAGVERYPSWFFPGQGIDVGVKKPEDLAKKANCPVGGVEVGTTTETSEGPKSVTTESKVAPSQTTQSSQQ